MQIIISHVNTDFDALASLVAAQKIHPEAQIVISDKQTVLVKQFLNIYRDTFEFLTVKQVDWEAVTKLILVDVASLDRVGNLNDKLTNENIEIVVYDHHPYDKNDVTSSEGLIEQVGATATLLVEKIRANNLPITPLEATLFGLGIYTDTGFFTYKNTTERDFKAASYLMANGMNLEMIDQFTEQSLQPEQQKLLDKLFLGVQTVEIDGLEIAITTYQHDAFLGGLSTITEKLLEIRGTDAVIAVVGMNKHVFIVGRASSERITLLPLLKQFNGGGHQHAGSAMVRNAEREVVFNEVLEKLQLMVEPAITAREIMTSPVKTITPETTIEEAGNLMYRYKHSGYPVVEDEQLLGIITRRDLDKAKHHGLGHAPVKAYMTTNIITINEDSTLEQIRQIIIDHNIGRLPVVTNEKLIGIISRTDIIEAFHSKTLMADDSSQADADQSSDLKKLMSSQLPKNIFSLLKEIGNVGEQEKTPVYLIGGIVRDIFLNVHNDDIDIVVEGDGIEFANKLAATYGGDVVQHESFGTATWELPSGLKIDIASARLEYYERPASLPDVELSTLKEDLYRRDFTINAMAICLNDSRFGELIDPFSGRVDLNDQRLKVLHNLSFVEDPTRILRAVRFELRFNFKMDNQTEQLALNSIDKITELSAERIINELNRILNANQATKVIERLFELKFWQQFNVQDEEKVPTLKWTRQLLANTNNVSIENLTFNWFQLFIIPFYVSDKLTAGEKFALTKTNIKFIQELKTIKNIDLATFKNSGDLHRLLKPLSREAIAFKLPNLPNEQHRLVINYLDLRTKLTSFLTGDDLEKLGVKPGPFYSEIFLELEVKIINQVVTSKESALEWLKGFLADQNKA